MSRMMMPGLIPVAFQRSVLTTNTAVAVNGTVIAAKPDVLLIGVETNAARMRCDAPPTATTGILFPASNAPWPFYDYNRTSAMRFISSSSTSTLSIAAYRYAKPQVS